MKTCIVIPAFNEASRIGPVVEKVCDRWRDVVVVDDGSTDNTSQVVRGFPVTLLGHVVNLGKGAALKTGCDYALSKDFERIVVMDADGQHDPQIIPKFVKALDNADIVFGFRNFDHRMPVTFRLGNLLIDGVLRILYGLPLRDTQSGFRAFRASVYPRIRWNSSDYSMESEMIARVARHRLRFVEIPIETKYADRYKGTTVFTGVKIVANIIKWRLVGGV